MSTEVDFNLPDIPDLSGILEQETPTWADGWYEGQIVERRSFVDKNGNERVFESGDMPSQKGDSRNIRLQAVITRKADGRTLATSVLVNYNPMDLSPETVNAVKERASNGGQMGDLFRPFMAIQRIGRLQQIAGVRQLQRNGNGGLDLSPVFGKKAYFRLGQDDRNPQYREVKEFRAEPPKKAQVQ